MLTSKTFVKKTKKGSVIQVVREHYLRDDVWCGVQGCTACSQDDPPLPNAPLMDSDLCPYPHYLVPDTNIFLHEIDFLEDPAIRNVIVLQIVLDEVKHRNLSVYQRLRDVIADKTKRFYVFANEHRMGDVRAARRVRNAAGQERSGHTRRCGLVQSAPGADPPLRLRGDPQGHPPLQRQGQREQGPSSSGSRRSQRFSTRGPSWPTRPLSTGSPTQPSRRRTTPPSTPSWRPTRSTWRSPPSKAA